jgi:hypothetical protein
VLGAVERRAWALEKPLERAPRVEARGMSCLNMAAVCGTRVGGVERGGEERRRNVCWRWTRGGVVPSKLVSEMFVRELQAVAPLGARVVFGGLLGLRDHPHKPSNLCTVRSQLPLFSRDHAGFRLLHLNTGYTFKLPTQPWYFFLDIHFTRCYHQLAWVLGCSTAERHLISPTDVSLTYLSGTENHS